MSSIGGVSLPVQKSSWVDMTVIIIVKLFGVSRTSGVLANELYGTLLSEHLIIIISDRRRGCRIMFRIIFNLSLG